MRFKQCRQDSQPVFVWTFDRVVDRVRARAERDFDTADRLRDELQERNIVVEDTAKGARWSIEPGAGA